ncbi:hypothetical protein Leryth_013359 [Lithospermum erythrorhizon]|nr:hypothetical protein Leryth_013359 [Lithospermum erythrorhizon]
MSIGDQWLSRLPCSSSCLRIAMVACKNKVIEFGNMYTSGISILITPPYTSVSTPYWWL